MAGSSGPAEEVRSEPGPRRERLHAKVVTERVFNDPSQTGSVTFRVVESDDPIAAVLERSGEFDLILVGATEQWGLASQRFGWRAEPLARESGTSLLVVRRGPAAGVNLRTG